MKRIFIVVSLVLSGCESYHTLETDTTLIQIDFDNDLNTRGSVALSGQAHDGDAEYTWGQKENALFSLGDGRWVEFETNEKVFGSNAVDISFDFRRADWKNPYTKGSGIQTMVVVSSVNPAKISHIIFNVMNGSDPNIDVSFESADGQKYRLRSPQGFKESDWQNVRLSVNSGTNETHLYLGDVQIGSASAVPAVISNGIDRIKFGTWHKKNQAYRGEIDNFLVAEMKEI